MPIWLEKYKPYFQNKEFLFSTVAAVLFLVAGILATFFAIIYATEKASAPVTDIILNNIPVFDLDGIFIWGPVIYWFVIGIYLVFRAPAKIPFTLKSISIFLFIRSLFLIMTHIGPFPSHTQINITGAIGIFASGSDLFFSSHTGMPFLIALVFWSNKKIRNLSLAASLIFGTVVLLAHLHYSIDVFAAFFITYAIFHIVLKLFKKDRQIFLHGLKTDKI